MIRRILKRLSAAGLLVILLSGLLAGCIPATPPPPTSTPLAPATTPTPVQPTLTPTPASKLVSGTNGLPWWNDTVFYEIFVRSFSDSNGDGKGDFNGITAKLDYLEGLGIKGIWLMPINPSPSYHGYDVTDYYGVNSDYGTLDDFKRLLSEAHKRGIRIIMDLVLNHTSSQHPWFQQAQDPKSKYHDWYIWSDTDPGYLGPWGEEVWHPAAGGGYYYGIFTAEMPDLNYRNPEVTQEMEKITKFWLDLGVDGYRLDAAKHLIEENQKQQDTQATLDWYKGFKTFYKGVNPQAMVVGEANSTSVITVQYIRQNGMDLTFDFDLASNWMGGILNGNSDRLINSTQNENDIYKGEQLATFLTNHDQNRVMSQFYGVTSKAKQAAVVLLTNPGVPFIYYGEEIGMTGPKPDEKIRTPMQWTAGDAAGFSSGSPWEAVNSDYPQKNVEIENQDPTSILNLYKDLIKARNQHEALRVGNLIKVDTGSTKVYAMLRTTDREAVLILVNLDKDPVSDYKLSFAGSNLKGNYSLQPLVGEGVFTNLAVNDQGGVDGFQPASPLGGYANLVLLLQPVQ